jgi:hypothetical protein
VNRKRLASPTLSGKPGKHTEFISSGFLLAELQSGIHSTGDIGDIAESVATVAINRSKLLKLNLLELDRDHWLS